MTTLAATAEPLGVSDVRLTVATSTEHPGVTMVHDFDLTWDQALKLMQWISVALMESDIAAGITPGDPDENGGPF